MTDFTDLPLADGAAGEKWQTVTADGLAAYLGSDEDERRERMGRTVEEAKGDAWRPLRLYGVPTADVAKPLCELWNGDGGISGLPLMVTRQAAGGPMLVGIVTAFDLL